MVNEFKQDNKDWEGGDSTNFYTYLLLDPKVINEIPYWNDNTTSHNNKWNTFVRSIFYVGKGQGSRPYDHLQEAKDLLKTYDEVRKTNKKMGKKIQRIWQIWSEGSGVMIFKAFESIKSVEACTREAVIIETLGKQCLCNEKNGTNYGKKVPELNKYEKSRFGKYLLLQAMRKFLNKYEEIQVFPRHLQ
ncbi:ankyrin repeat and LEM domain-containing protein 1-like [Cloeon dipterum]|uniref:ankyrin repeat and LEM domain-containing protein 1-like n=1 Tax=Cloeon dipterum TaxID=197152 RepID=UPI0032200BCD